MIEERVVAALETVPALGGKVYPLCLPEGTEPSGAVYFTRKHEELLCLSGGTGYWETEIELHLLHSGYAALKRLADIAREALTGMADRDTAVTLLEPQDSEAWESGLPAYRNVILAKISHKEE